MLIELICLLYILALSSTKKQFFDLLDNILSENCFPNTTTILTWVFTSDFLKTEKIVKEYRSVISSNDYKTEKKLRTCFRETFPLSESEVLEAYNRRENIRIFGLQE